MELSIQLLVTVDTAVFFFLFNVFRMSPLLKLLLVLDLQLSLISWNQQGNGVAFFCLFVNGEWSASSASLSGGEQMKLLKCNDSIGVFLFFGLCFFQGKKKYSHRSNSNILCLCADREFRGITEVCVAVCFVKPSSLVVCDAHCIKN